MANVIHVTPEKLKSSAASFKDTGAEIKRTTSQMMELITGISGTVWSGEACSAYLSKFKGLDSDIAKMCKMVEDQAQHLVSIADEYQSAEAQNKAAAATLKNNVIV